MCWHCVATAMVGVFMAWQAWQMGLRAKVLRWAGNIYWSTCIFHRGCRADKWSRVLHFFTGHGEHVAKYSGGTYCLRCGKLVRT